MYLVLGGVSLGELEGDTLAGQSLVNLGVGVKSVVNTTSLLLIENDLEQLAAILLLTETLADDLNGVDEVAEDSVVDSGESSGSGTLLLLVGARAV